MGEWTKEDLEKVFLAVKKKAMTDVDFRKLALSDAAAAVKAVAGKDLPVEMKLKFIENDGAHMAIVLPDMAESEMSEEDLDSVAGGISIYTVWGCPTKAYC